MPKRACGDVRAEIEIPIAHARRVEREIQPFLGADQRSAANDLRAHVNRYSYDPNNCGPVVADGRNMECEEVRFDLTTARAMVASYLDLFDSYWSRATPIGINPLNESTKPLSTMHQMVLSHVLTGKSADTIARLLKVDSRTIRRRIDELCKYYDVDSRSALIAAALARDTLARDILARDVRPV